MSQLNQPDLSGAWPVWRAHYYRANSNTVAAGKRQKQQFRRQITRDWNRLNAWAKADLRDHIRPVKAAIDAEELARREIQRWHNDHPAGSILTPQTDNVHMRHERFMLAKIQQLAATQRLVRRELRHGGAADFLRNYDEGRIPILKDEILRQGRDVAAATYDYEQRQGHNLWRGPSQESEPPNAVHGGRMWYNPLAAGGNTWIGLWLEGDAHDNIADRIIVKDTFFNNLIDWWTDPSWWIRDPLDPVNKRIPEVEIMRHLNSTNQENIIRLRSHHMFAHKLTYRIYMEYCPHGDAGDLLNGYLGESRMNNNTDGHIPEPAIWHIFECLVNAGLIMQQGNISQPDAAWIGDGNFEENGVVHLDIKPNNVFIGDYPSQENDFAMYPTFKLADFGFSIQLERRNREGYYLTRGTEGYFAPEQLEPPKDPGLSSKTNVWGIGVTMMALMNLDENPSVMVPIPNHEAFRVPRLGPKSMAYYSDRLVALVERCVQYDQDLRAEFGDLLTAVQNNTGGNPNAVDMAQGARAGKKHSVPPDLTLLQHLGENKYALGMTMPIDDDMMREGVKGAVSVPAAEGTGPRRVANRRRSA